VAGDFSQIEARMLAWLAGQDDVLKIFADGHDVYTYDANKLGSTNRQLGKTFRLGAGYGTGVAKIIAIARGYGVTLTLTEAQALIWKWRSDNPYILQLWRDLDLGMRRIIACPPGTRRLISRRIGAVRTTGGVALVLPSGRWLIYRNARVELDPDDGRDSIVYDGISPYTNQWGPIRTWGSKLTADATQGAARDVMARAMTELDGLGGIALLLSVHDELIGEIDEAYGEEGLRTMMFTMRDPPPWAIDLPVAAAGWHGPRYHKE
jgi:DNA polymerase bacteriophage-type